ncbi:MAG: DUF4038 domain-containing protein [Armatimonadota bacterium]|nr:DUF4038 domain-containing protein [Armatimonadota bacterium]
MKAITRSEVTEWAFTTSKSYDDPFNDVEVNVIFSDDRGTERSVPAFWAGGNVWKVRFAPPDIGKYRFRAVCSDETNSNLHGMEDEFEVLEYGGDNPFLRHGRIGVSRDRRHFAHRDGTPFFWLADTWWMGLCRRLDWPAGFQTLAIDRVRKGYSVIQIVAGLYPDMPAFDERGSNEAGFPWEPDYARVNPAYFDMADRRIRYLVDMGLMPCIVGCWGYFLRFMGVEKMKQHWRNLIARYGAYPVVWCLAGEAIMAYYLSRDLDGDAQFQKKGWTELAHYVRETDPFDNLVTVHPTDIGRNQLADPSLMDFEMFQGGHADRVSFPGTMDKVVASYEGQPLMPFIDAEVAYEGIGEACRQELQRLEFWSSMLSGAAGHTYGANGIWQVNTREKPYGPSPHGMAWGNTPWEDAYQLPGSAHVGLGKRILERFEWHRFEPHPEWIEPHWSKENYFGPFAAGIPGKTRVIYFPHSHWGTGVVKGIEKGVNYRAYLVNPIDGKDQELGTVAPNGNGDWEIPLGVPPFKLMPIFQDWVLVLEAV